jgi:deazaflavin-dependent oxidoreductase (nitroreductase family)
MAREYRYTWFRRFANALLKAALKAGIGPSRTRLLTVTGRRSGRPYVTPVNLVVQAGTQYLVSPYGERAWVKNARAAGQVSLRRGKESASWRIEELPAADAAPVLADYWRQNLITRPFFDAKPDLGTAWAAEASKHPVFRLWPV